MNGVRTIDRNRDYDEIVIAFFFLYQTFLVLYIFGRTNYKKHRISDNAAFVHNIFRKPTDYNNMMFGTRENDAEQRRVLEISPITVLRRDM